MEVIRTQVSLHFEGIVGRRSLDPLKLKNKSHSMNETLSVHSGARCGSQSQEGALKAPTTRFIQARCFFQEPLVGCAHSEQVPQRKQWELLILLVFPWIHSS